MSKLYPNSDDNSKDGANQKSLSFLQGGGEMGEQIRSFNWAATPLGNPDTWPHGLRSAVRLMLDNSFAMYIAWGDDHIQLYNDAYRPILGTVKHPKALGISTRETLAEAWATISPIFEKVKQGSPVGFKDLVLNLSRNGFIEECFFDFSYTPIRLEDGKVAGVLVTVVETTEKVKVEKALKKSENELRFAIESTELGTWGFNPLTNKFKCNTRFKTWFGLAFDEEIKLSQVFENILPNDKEAVKSAIDKALQFSSDDLHDITFSIIHPKTKEVKIVRAKGRASFDQQGMAHRFNGTLQDVTEEMIAKELLLKSERRLSNERIMLYNSFMNAPAAIAIFKGESHIYEFANAEYEKIVEREIVIGKTLKELFPEVEQQGLIELVNNVFSTGEPFIANEFPVKLLNKKTGNLELGYYNSVLQPIKDENGNTERLLSLGVEVTQLVEARKQIEESEQRFRKLSEAVPHMIWTADSEGKRNFFNKQALEYTGKTVEELSGDGWLQMIFGPDLEPTLIHWQHCLKTGEDFKFENRWRRHDGSYRWHLANAIAQKDEQGNIIGWVGTNTNIHSQKTFAEELETKVQERTYQLHIQNESFKQAEESSLQGSYSFNLTSGKLSYSNNLYRLLGYEPDEFEAELVEFNKHVHPEDKKYVDEATEKVLQSHSPEDWYYRMVTKKGTIVNIKATGRVIEWRDEKLLVGTLQDVTKEFALTKELQEKEEYRKKIIQNAPDAVIVIDEESIITLWNPKTEEVFGWKAEEVLGLCLTDLIVPFQHRQAHAQGLKRYLETGEAKVLNKSLELTALNKAGKEFPISLTVSQSTQQGKKLFIAFLRDISSEKRTIELAISNKALLKANLQLEAAQKLSEQLLRQKDEFISIASHEMKTPLTSAKGYTELMLLALGENHEAFSYATKANHAVDRLHKLIIELLDASRIQNGQLNLNVNPFDFNEMVNETIEELVLSDKSHRIERTGKLSGKIPGDRDRLQQVVINLLSNAIKYSPSAEKVLLNISDQSDELKVSVQDFGVGMEKEHLERVFERYYRVDEHSVNFQGLGIGLYISHNIVERHGGKMWAESETGKGSTFYFTIPT